MPFLSNPVINIPSRLPDWMHEVSSAWRNSSNSLLDRNLVAKAQRSDRHNCSSFSVSFSPFSSATLIKKLQTACKYAPRLECADLLMIKSGPFRRFRRDSHALFHTSPASESGLLAPLYPAMPTVQSGHSERTSSAFIHNHKIAFTIARTHSH